MKRIHHFLGYLKFVFARFNEDRCPQAAGSLTYTTLLSLVPFITVAVSLFSAFPAFGQLLIHLQDFIEDNMLPDTAEKIIIYMGQFSEKASRLNAIGIAVLAVTSIMLILTIDRTFNQIWRVHRARSLLIRCLTYWAVLTLGPLLIGASLSITSYVIGISSGLHTHLETLSKEFLRWVPLLLTTIAFTMIYLIVPNRYVALRHALLGGFLAAVFFEMMKRGFALYIAKVPTYTLVYGVFASIPIFLIWLYLSWTIVLLGAVITATLPHFKDYRLHVNKLPGTDFYEALLILRALVLSQQNNQPLKLRAISAQTNISIDLCEELLGKLAYYGWVGKLSKGGWALTCDPENVKLYDIYKCFVLNLPESIRAQAGGQLSQTLAELSQELDEKMQISLKSLV